MEPWQRLWPSCKAACDADLKIDMPVCLRARVPALRTRVWTHLSTRHHEVGRESRGFGFAAKNVGTTAGASAAPGGSSSCICTSAWRLGIRAGLRHVGKSSLNPCRRHHALRSTRGASGKGVRATLARMEAKMDYCLPRGGGVSCPACLATRSGLAARKPGADCGFNGCGSQKGGRRSRVVQLAHAARMKKSFVGCQEGAKKGRSGDIVCAQCSLARLCIASPRRFAMLCFALLCCALLCFVQGCLSTPNDARRLDWRISIGIHRKQGLPVNRAWVESAYSMSQRLPSLAEPYVHPLRPSSEAALPVLHYPRSLRAGQLAMGVKRRGRREPKQELQVVFLLFLFFPGDFRGAAAKTRQHSTAIAKQLTYVSKMSQRVAPSSDAIPLAIGSHHQDCSFIGRSKPTNPHR
ncbi:hypothetical protein L1887_48180 [Cichorium endivia]|nr:hypothetical protein L1887_48180 [Cichorium endivia]